MKLNVYTLFLFFFSALSSIEAYAYIDPAAGSAILQGVIAGAAALGVAVKFYWDRIRRFIGDRTIRLKERVNEISQQKNSKSRGK